MTVGSLADEDESITWETAQRAILYEFGDRYRLEEGQVSEDALARARELLVLSVP
jgi:hypothetical protein